MEVKREEVINSLRVKETENKMVGEKLERQRELATLMEDFKQTIIYVIYLFELLNYQVNGYSSI